MNKNGVSDIRGNDTMKKDVSWVDSKEVDDYLKKAEKIITKEMREFEKRTAFDPDQLRKPFTI